MVRSRCREALDIVLAGGAFDLPIGLLFLDDGVLQLAAGQNAKALQQKDLSANLQALPIRRRQLFRRSSPNGE